MNAGASVTCGVCGETIETPARDLVIGSTRLAGALIDLDENHAAFMRHYDEKHPELEKPGRVW